MIDTDTAVEDFRNRCLCIRHTGQLFIIQIELYLLDIMKLRSSPCDCLQNTQLILLIYSFSREFIKYRDTMPFLIEEDCRVHSFVNNGVKPLISCFPLI